MAGNAFKTRHGVVKLSATEKVSNKKKKKTFLHKTHDATTPILRTFDLVR